MEFGMSNFTRVELFQGQHSKRLTGKIVGTASIQRSPETVIQFLYMVELDEGFYNKDGDVWVSILAVDGNLIHPIE